MIDLGPGAGDEGGRIVAAGTPADVARERGSKTAPYLAERLSGSKAPRWNRTFGRDRSPAVSVAIAVTRP